MKEDDLIRNINPFGLRMQPALKARIEEEAKKNHRSINAEITARLEESLGLPQSKPEKSSEEVLHVAVQLDSSGYPISWHEIHEHLSAINRTGKFAPVDQKVSIITPNLVSSSKRQDEADAVADFYRKERRKLAKQKPTTP